MSNRSNELFRTCDVARALRLTRRQLHYWARTGLVRPTERTKGGHHRYTRRDFVALEATKRLIDAGVSVQRIRKSIQALRRILPSVSKPLSELVLVATGDVVLVFSDGTAFEAVTGQEWVFEVAVFQREVDSWKHALAKDPGRRARSVRSTQKQISNAL